MSPTTQSCPTESYEPVVKPAATRAGNGQPTPTPENTQSTAPWLGGLDTKPVMSVFENWGRP